MLLGRVFEKMKTALDKHELRSLARKLGVPEEKMVELEQTHHGKDKLQVQMLLFLVKMLLFGVKMLLFLILCFFKPGANLFRPSLLQSINPHWYNNRTW